MCIATVEEILRELVQEVGTYCSLGGPGARKLSSVVSLDGERRMATGLPSAGTTLRSLGEGGIRAN